MKTILPAKLHCFTTEFAERQNACRKFRTIEKVIIISVRNEIGYIQIIPVDILNSVKNYILLFLQFFPDFIL